MVEIYGGLLSQSVPHVRVRGRSMLGFVVIFKRSVVLLFIWRRLDKNRGEKMPIKVEEAKKYAGYEDDEVKIAKFLTKNSGQAFLEDEIMRGIGKTQLSFTPDEKGSYWTGQNVGFFALNVASIVFFRNTLENMVRKRKINVSEVAGKKYYFIEEGTLLS